MSTQRGIKHHVVVSDLHVGCEFGLCPKKGYRTDSGGHYTPNRIQRESGAMWDEFWRKWVPSVVGRQPFDITILGDTIDGSHHGSVHQWTHNLETQEAAAVELLNPIAARARAFGGRFFMVRGTEAHVGQSGQNEESIAKQLDAVPNRDAQHARHELNIRIGSGLINMLHHVGTTSSAAYESTAVHKELVEAYNEAARWNLRAFAGVVRAHRHRCIHIKIPSARGNDFSVTTPGWQAKTPWAYKVAGARQSSPQFGGICIIDAGEPEGLYVRTCVWTIGRSAPE